MVCRPPLLHRCQQQHLQQRAQVLRVHTAMAWDEDQGRLPRRAACRGAGLRTRAGRKPKRSTHTCHPHTCGSGRPGKASAAPAVRCPALQGWPAGEQPRGMGAFVASQRNCPVQCLHLPQRACLHLTGVGSRARPHLHPLQQLLTRVTCRPTAALIQLHAVSLVPRELSGPGIMPIGTLLQGAGRAWPHRLPETLVTGCHPRMLCTKEGGGDGDSAALLARQQPPTAKSHDARLQPGAPAAAHPGRAGGVQPAPAPGGCWPALPPPQAPVHPLCCSAGGSWRQN